MAPSFEPNSGVVLIVDDFPDNLSLLSVALDAAGYVVLVARDGESALRTLRRATPDIILLDALMPGMDGFETCARIRREPDYRHIPVIFMTALTDSEHVLRGFEVGAVDYVTKPINTDEVLARLGAHLRVSRHLAQVTKALEASGQAVFVSNARGVVIWASSRAAQLLQRHLSAPTDGYSLLNAQCRQWIQETVQSPETDAGSATMRIERSGLLLKMLGGFAENEFLLTLEEDGQPDDTRSLMQRFNLTSREAEVLMWAAKGKASRDIAQILEMSPRTVDKHFEHIFAKLGTENRTSAVSVALHCLRNEESSKN